MNFEKFLKIIEKALLIRTLEQELLKLFTQGKLNGTLHTCVGQELTGVCIAQYLTKDDFVFSNHRGHGHFIAFTDEVDGLVLEVMGKKNGVSGGIGGSQHLYFGNFISNGIQGGMVPIAAGVAYAEKVKNNNNIAVVFIGDGTLGEGILYETLNICSIWDLPLLIILENNNYAQSTSIKQSFAGDIGKRVSGFGINYFKSDTWDLEKLTETCYNSINYVRSNIKPAFIEISTYRLNSHSKSDDNRDINEVEYYNKIDLLNIFEKTNKNHFENLYKKNKERIEKSVNKAILSSDLEEIEENVYVYLKKIKYVKNNLITGKINNLIYESIKEQFEAHENTFFIGEDIEEYNIFTPKKYGGAFKISKDLSTSFKGKVKNTPISEAAITGIATGLALNGYYSIVEIMFGDFMTLIFDQIFNHATKFCSMYNKPLSIPLIIRTPMGGRRGYGPTHSQSIEKFFFGIPNLNVIALNSRISPKLIYKNIFDNINQPYLVIENKILYTRFCNQFEINGFTIEQSDDLFPVIKISPIDKRAKLTIFCYGGVMEEVEKSIQDAFDEEEIFCELIAYTQLCPLNIHPIIESVSRTENLLIVEEGSNFASLSSEIAAQLLERNIKPKRFERIANNNIIPCSMKAEQSLLPNSQSIFEMIKRITK